MDFTSVYNTHEKTIFEAVTAAAPRYPGIADDPGLLADVACVALNRMPPPYIRHSAGCEGGAAVGTARRPAKFPAP